MKGQAAMALTADVLGADGLAHGFFTRQGGVSTGVYASLNGGVGSRDEAERVAENRRRMAVHLKVQPESLLVPYQTHSPDAVIVTEPFSERPRCDALVTAVPGIALGVTGADCGMILLADVTAGVIGAAHAGWKGALAGVIEATLEAMEALGAKRASIAAALGPAIGRESYEVGPEFLERFVAVSKDYACFFVRSGGMGDALQDHKNRFLFDLPGFIAMRLRHAGIETFEDLARNTYAEAELFYSYRRSVHRGEPDYGRQVAAIALI